MLPEKSISQFRPGWARYGIALLTVTAVLFIRWLLDPLLKYNFPFITLYGGVVLAVWLCRWRPATLAALMGFVASEYLFTPPRYTLELKPAELAGGIGYLMSAGLVILTGELMHHARERAERDSAERKRVEIALRVKEKELENIIGNTPFMLTRCTRDLRYQFVSAAHAAMVGRKPDEITGKTIVEIMGEEAFNSIRPHIEKVLAGHRVEYECDAPYPNHGKRSLHVIYTPDKDDRGNICGWIASIVDITQRKRMEEALRESERRERERAVELATLLEAAPTPVFIVHDPACVHMSANRAGSQLLQIGHDHEISLSAPPDKRPRHFRAVKDGRELRLDELPAQRAALGEPVRDFEFSLVFDNGTVRDVLGYGTPLFDEQNRPRGAVHVLVDITERKRAEDQLRCNTERYRMLVSVIADVPWTANAQGVFIEAQQAWEKYTGQKWEEYCGSGWFNALHPDDQLVAEETWRRACADGSDYESQGRLWHAPAQQYRYVLTRAVPMRNADGTVREWVGTCLDIHDKKMAVDALRDAQRKLVRHVANLESQVVEK